MLHTLFIRESLETMGVTTPTHGFWRASRMRVHRNAKTTAEDATADRDAERQQGWTYARIAEASGISVRTVAKWMARSRHAMASWTGRPGRIGSHADCRAARGRDPRAAPDAGDGLAD